MENYLTIKIKDTIFIHDLSNMHIVDSYKVPNKLVREYLVKFTKTSGIYYRDIDSMEKEWIAHNILYKLGMFKNHTKDTDITVDESWYRLLGYEVIYRLYKIYKFFKR